MQHALPAITLDLFLPESHVGAPLVVAIIEGAVGRSAPDLLGDAVDNFARLCLRSPRLLLIPLAVAYLFAQLLVSLGEICSPLCNLSFQLIAGFAELFFSVPQRRLGAFARGTPQLISKAPRRKLIVWGIS